MMLTVLKKKKGEPHCILVTMDKMKWIVPYDPKLGHFENHANAAKKIGLEIGWPSLCHGDHPLGYVFLNAKMLT